MQNRSLVNVKVEPRSSSRLSSILLSCLYFIHLGPVVRRPVSANLGLNFNPGFFLLLSKALSQIIFTILFRVSNHQIVGKENKTEYDF